MASESLPTLTGQRVFCRLACVPLRAEPDLVSEMMSQALAGETAIVLEDRVRYYKVRLEHDGYEAWVDARHFVKSPDQARLPDNLTEKVPLPVPVPVDPARGTWDWVVGESFASISNGRGQLLVPLGTPLAGFSEKKCQFQLGGEMWELKGKALRVARDGQFGLSKAEFLAWGQKLLHTPYVWGGRTPLGLDCSGLAQLMHRLGGIFIGRDTIHQMQQGVAVASLAAAEVGDLVFFQSSRDAARHVGLIWEKGLILHCSGLVRLDPIRAEGIFNSETGELTHQFHSVRKLGVISR